MAATLPLRSLDDAQRWLARLEASPSARAGGAWPLAAVLDHLAQGIEMSLEGYPRPRSPLFQRTVGRFAFGVFQRRGRMRHSLSEPIPGAPPLRDVADVAGGIHRLRTAITRFEQHQGALQPHFAYGLLDKSAYSQAHVLHIADHQREITGA